ncbi:hypothetical protein GCM10009641_88530 [Mycobacterium cookii]
MELCCTAEAELIGATAMVAPTTIANDAPQQARKFPIAACSHHEAAPVGD